MPREKSPGEAGSSIGTKWHRLPSPSFAGEGSSAPASLRRLLEVSQVGRCLALPCRHQQSVPAQKIGVLADHNIVRALDTGDAAPVRMGIGVAPKSLVDAPRPR